MYLLQIYTPILNVILGTLLLFAGLKLFWFFIGILGFILGFNLIQLFLPAHADWIVFTISLLAGIMGAFLAIFFKKIAIILVGSFIGSYLLFTAYLNFFENNEILIWVVLIAGAILGGMIFTLFFDWVLIIFSALLGAAMITGIFNLEPGINMLVFFALFITGLISQVILLKRSRETQ